VSSCALRQTSSPRKARI